MLICVYTYIKECNYGGENKFRRGYGFLSLSKNKAPFPENEFLETHQKICIAFCQLISFLQDETNASLIPDMVYLCGWFSTRREKKFD